jgi:hypothetical protein
MSTKFNLPTATDLARAHTAEAIGTLVTVMRDPAAKPSERVSAAQTLLDRGHGRAVQATISVPARVAASRMLADLTDDALLLIAARRQGGGGYPPNEGPKPGVSAGATPPYSHEPSAENGLQVARSLRPGSGTLDANGTRYPFGRTQAEEDEVLEAEYVVKDEGDPTR